MSNRQRILLVLMILTARYGWCGENMSNISIPGVSSRLQTDKYIEDIMKVERAPLDRVEARRDTFQQQKTTWQDVNRNLTRLRDASRGLFGHQNPFSHREAVSSDERILTAAANRDAPQEIREITVKQTAQGDKFLSNSLSRDFQVPAGRYGFQVGEDTVSFDFRGGDLQSFQTAVNRRTRGLVSASVINDTRDTQVITLEANRKGASQQLTLLEESQTFGEQAGLIKPVPGRDKNITISEDLPASWRQPLDEREFRVEDGSLHIQPATEMELPVSPAVNMEEGDLLEITVTVRTIPEEELETPSPPPGPDVRSPGTVSLEDVTIEHAPSNVVVPEWDPPEPPQRVDNLQVLYANRDLPLPRLQDRDGTQTIQVPAGQLGNRLSSVNIANENTHREIIIESVRVYNPEIRDGFTPVNPITTARDAVVEVDGIRAVRESNEIDDLLPGVTLNLRRPSLDPVEIEVGPDYEKIKDEIITFVGYYNQTLVDLHILTSRDERIINEIDYFTPEEREAALEKLGLFQGDSAMNQLKTRLQRMVMDPYTTSAGNELSLLAQLGISTSAAGFGFGSGNMRGYLEINEAQLDQALETNLRAVRELFGMDTTGDRLTDSGLGYTMDNYLNNYTRTGGMIATRIAGIDRQIVNTNREITRVEERLDRREDQLRREFGRMEGAMSTLEDSQRTIQGLEQLGQQGR